MNAGTLSTSHPVPGRLAPTIAGATVIVLALPVFLVASWPLAGWVLAAVLWTAALIFSLVLARLPTGPGNLAAAGMRGIGTTSRAFLVAVPLIVVATSDEAVGIAAASLYALAYTFELVVGLVEYFGQERSIP